MIRPARISDFPQCEAIALRHAERYPELRPNRDSMRKLFSECASSARNFSCVSEVDGVIVGVILALSSDHLWAQKQSSCILIWACEKSGDGISMLRKYRDWVRDRPGIRRAGFQFDIDIDQRILNAIARAGFARHGGCYLHTKGQ